MCSASTPKVDAEYGEGLLNRVQSSGAKRSSEICMHKLEVQQQTHFTRKSYFSVEKTIEMQECASLHLPQPKVCPESGSKPALTSQPTHAPGKRSLNPQKSLTLKMESLHSNSPFPLQRHVSHLVPLPTFSVLPIFQHDNLLWLPSPPLNDNLTALNSHSQHTTLPFHSR